MTRIPQQLQQALSQFVFRFNAELHDYLKTKGTSVPQVNQATKALILQLDSSTSSGGKRVRPFLTMLGLGLWGDSKVTLESILKVQLAQELFQSFALLHDDIMDSALVRRGTPTIEAVNRLVFASVIENKELRERTALNTSLMAGDMAFAWAQELCMTYCLLKATPLVHQEWSDMVSEVLIGQNEDSFGLSLRSLADISEEEIYNMIDLKSGRYTIARPLVMGAVLGGASAQTRDAVFAAGQKLGIAFQLKDDLLGLYGEEGSVGKSTVSDITEGKRTLLVKRAFERSTPSDQQKMMAILGNKDANTWDIEWVKEQVELTGVRQETEIEVSRLVDEFLGFISIQPGGDTEAKQLLGELAYYIIERNK